MRQSQTIAAQAWKVNTALTSTNLDKVTTTTFERRPDFGIEPMSFAKLLWVALGIFRYYQLAATTCSLEYNDLLLGLMGRKIYRVAAWIK